ncbi:kynurenine formamidase [Euwallacea fornicatus]|uniref:kynurenine formamidase n=1 Tax=Euwallacea fornicatus TaxID=995702 RepID=UPI00338E23CC
MNKDLETLYSPSHFSKRYSKDDVIAKHLEFINTHTKLVRDTIPHQVGISYGPGPREKYDIYGTDLSDESPILIHIHGGYYQDEPISHSNNGFISHNLYKNGIKTILLGYELSPQRNVGEILEHLHIGLIECLKYAKRHQSKAIFLSGHSVGGHAIATMLPGFKRSIPPEDRNLIKGCFLLCGLYNMEPLTKVSANQLLGLSVDTARELSPLFNVVDYGGTVIYVVGAEYDSPAFVEQSLEFYNKIQRLGVRSHLKIIPMTDHFDVIENLFDENFELTKLIVNAIQER